MIVPSLVNMTNQSLSMMEEFATSNPLNSSQVSSLTSDEEDKTTQDVTSSPNAEVADTLSTLATWTTYIAYLSNYIFITVGVVFNIIALVFFLQKARKQRRCVDIYLAALAACDMLVVLNMPLLFIFLMRDTPINLHWLSGCNLFGFLIAMPASLSVLIVTTITVDRFTALYFPFEFRRMQSVKKSLILLATEAVLVSLFHFYTFGGFYAVDATELENVYFAKQCRGRTKAIDQYYFKFLPWIEAVTCFLIPAAVLFVCNILIIIKMVNATKKKKPEPPTEMMRENQAGNVAKKLAKHDMEASKALQKHGGHLTKVCLVVSVSFVLLVMPHVGWRLAILNDSLPSLVPGVETIIENVFALMTMINYSVNFIFYCIMIPSLRKELRKKVSERNSFFFTTFVKGKTLSKNPNCNEMGVRKMYLWFQLLSIHACLHVQRWVYVRAELHG